MIAKYNKKSIVIGLHGLFILLILASFIVVYNDRITNEAFILIPLFVTFCLAMLLLFAGLWFYLLGKGYSGWLALLLFLMGPFGILVFGLLPDKGRDKANAAKGT